MKFREVDLSLVMNGREETCIENFKVKYEQWRALERPKGRWKFGVKIILEKEDKNM
jgi:hypothetical protein